MSRRSKRVIAYVVVIALAVIGMLVTSEVLAQEASVSIDTIVHAPEGSLRTLREPTTPESLGLEVGALCGVSAVGFNQSSPHDGNNVEIGDASAFVTLIDVESEPGKTTIANGLLVLPPLISFVLRMGPDGVYSGGLSVVFDCPETPTTTAPTTTTTTPGESPTTTTTTPQTTTSTTEPPPVDAPQTGGGACAGGACAPAILTAALSPLVTWIALGISAWIVAIIAIVIWFHGATKGPR